MRLISSVARFPTSRRRPQPTSSLSALAERDKDAKNHYRLYVSVAGGGRLLIAKLKNGVEIPLKAVSIPNPAVGAAFHLTGSVKGTTLKVSIAGTELSVADTEYDSGGVGVLLKTGPPGTHTADNFCAAVGTGSCP